MSETAESLDFRRKRVLWRASHRGMREMDLLLGGFARARIGALDGPGLDALEAIIAIPDQTLFAWATGEEAPLPEQASPLLGELLAFRP